MKGNLKQRLFAILLCIVMIGISINITDIFNKKINAAASFISGSSGAKWEFTASSGTLKITNGGTIADFSSFSETPWASYKDDIKIVVMGYNQVNIPAHAFEGCTNLTKLQINVSSDGNSTCKMNSVGDYAFNGCTSLETITLSGGSTAKRFNNNTTTIGNYAFNGCSSLTYFPFNTSNGSSSKLASIGNYGFYGTGITEVIIPESSKLNQIGANAFPLNASIRIKDSFTCGVDAFDRIVNVFTYDVPVGYQINVNVTGEIYRSSEGCTSSNTFNMYGGGASVDASTAKTSGTCLATFTGSTIKDGILTTVVDNTYSYKNTTSSINTQRIFFNVIHSKHSNNGATNSYDITLTASVVKSYDFTINFNANGGTGSVPPSIKKTDSDSSVVMGDISSTIPTRTGYSFKGWSASSNWSTKRIAYSSNYGGSAALDGTTATTTQSTWTYADYCTKTGGDSSNRTLTLYAQWEAVPFTINYNANGGTGAPSATTITEKGDINSTVPTRTGYAFKGWAATSSWNTKRIVYLTSNGGSAASDGTSAVQTSSSWTRENYASNLGVSSIGNSITVYAQWDINKSTLTVNPNGGTVNVGGTVYTSSVSKTQNYNTTLTVNNPTRTATNYTATFNGNGGTAGSSSLKTNYAYSFKEWTKSSTFTAGTLSGTTFTFGATNGGTGTLTAAWNTSGSYTITLPTASRTNYKFNGWYTAASGGTKVGNAGATVTLSSNVTYYAQWTINQSTLTVNPNGGTVNVGGTEYTSSVSKTQNYNTTLTVNNPTRTATNYTATFNGNGGTAGSSSIKTNYAYSFKSWTQSSTFTAGTLSGTTFTFGSTNGGTGTLTAQWNTSGSYNITLPSATRTGYTFNGWYTAASGGTKIGNAGTTVTLSSNVTYYAQWTINKYTITYNGNGNTGGSTASQTFEYNKFPVIASNGFTKTNYTFNGWNTKADGTGTSYNVGDTFNKNENITLYAQWKLSSFKQIVQVRYQNIDGSFTDYETVIDKNYTVGDTVSWSRAETVEYETASISYTVTKEQTTQITINRKQYNITYIDVVDSENGTKLGTPIIDKLFYGSTATGATQGTNTDDNYYYYAYYYSSCTTAEVTENGATVYRIFKLRTIDINGSVNWNDKSNDYNSRPENVVVSLFRNGAIIDTKTGLTSKDNNSFSFTDLQKYDKATGKAYTYTVTQSEVISKNVPEDKYSTTQNGYNFTNTLGNADFHVEGTITWVDSDDKNGSRPEVITLNIYRNGILYDTQEKTKYDTGYSFTNLPKYDDDLNSYTYQVEETFVSKALKWNSETKTHEEVDAYKIEVDGFDFTNILNYIPVKPDYINTLTIKLDFNDNIDWSDIEKTSTEITSFVTLKQFETVVDENKNISYSSNYSGLEYNAIVNENGVEVRNIPSGKYEIVESNDNTFILEGIDLQTTNSYSVLNENNKWYLIIAETNENQTGIISLKLNADSFNGIDDSATINNLYSLGNTSTTQILMMSMFSDEVTVPEYVEPITYTITYKDCDVVDDTKYQENSEVTLKDCDIKGFLGWSEDNEAVEPQYMAGDTITLEKDLILYPVIKTSESTEENSSEETTEEIESEEQEETTETESTLEEKTSEVDESMEIVETETEEETISEEESSESQEDSSEIEETTESEEIESSAFSE